MAHTTTKLEAGRAALERRDWPAAFDLLEDEIDALEPEDLERLAQAAWWIGRLDICIDARERAYSAYVAHGDSRAAAVVAVDLTKDNLARRAGAASQAWFKRAERLLGAEPEGIEHAHLERFRSLRAFEGRGDFEAALEHARRCAEIATRFGDRDVLALSLHDQGRALVALRDVDEGFALMDEAMVAAVAGDLSPMTTGIVYCNMIVSCEELADYGRAAEWTEASKRWCERQAVAGFPGLCRVHRASVIRMRGEWEQAEAEVLMAYEELRDFNHSYAAEALYQLGEIHLEAGNLDDADDAFAKAQEHGRDPQPGLALLLHERGKTDSGIACLKRALADENRELHRARLLVPFVQLATSSGDVDMVRDAVDELEGIAAAYRTQALNAAALTARGELLIAENDAAAAVEKLRAAVRMWGDLDAPYLLAKTRLSLARAYEGEGDAEAAQREEAAAGSSLTQLRGAAEGAVARPSSSGGGRVLFRREGEYWTIGSGDRVFRLKDSKGLQHLRRLVSTPDRDIHVLDLARDAGRGDHVPRVGRDEVAIGAEDAGAVLDAEAKEAYRRRVVDLREEIDEAAGWGDLERAARARNELDAITEQLAGAVGLGGRDRKAASVSERARVNVTRSVKTSIDRISEHDPRLGRYLAGAVKTGTFCSYQPDPDAGIDWDL